MKKNSESKNIAKLPLDLAGISYKQFDFYKYSLQFEIIAQMAEEGETITDEIYAMILNPPPIYASTSPDDDTIVRERVEKYLSNRNTTLDIVKSVKAEFYEFFCTQKAYYKKQRNFIGGVINVLIIELSQAIATRLTNVNIGSITAIIAALLITVSKMTARVFCKMVKPEPVKKPAK